MKLKVAVLLSFLLLLSGCNIAAGKKDAEGATAKLMEDRITSGRMIDDSHYSSEFWKSTSKEEWGDIKDLVVTANGPLKEFELISWNVNTKAHTSQLSGTFVTLQYRTTYEKGSGQEKLVMHRKGKSNPFKILGHIFNTPEIAELTKLGIKAVAKSKSESAK